MVKKTMDITEKKARHPVEHLSRRYGYLAFALALVSFVSIQRGIVVGNGWYIATVVSLWLTGAAVLLFLAYEENDSTCFSKHEDGRFPLISWIVFFPYLLPLWIRQILLSTMSGENSSDKLMDGVFIGRRPVRARDIPSCTAVCVDLAAEFPASRAELKYGGRYVSFPILEASFRSCEALITCIDSLPESGLYIHCAQGHGRTGFFACALFLRRGTVETLPEAEALVTRVRPGVKFRKGQREFLEANVKLLKSRGSDKGQRPAAMRIL